MPITHFPGRYGKYVFISLYHLAVLFKMYSISCRSVIAIIVTGFQMEAMVKVCKNNDDEPPHLPEAAERHKKGQSRKIGMGHRIVVR